MLVNANFLLKLFHAGFSNELVLIWISKFPSSVSEVYGWKWSAYSIKTGLNAWRCRLSRLYMGSKALKLSVINTNTQRLRKSLKSIIPEQFCHSIPCVLDQLLPGWLHHIWCPHLISWNGCLSFHATLLLKKTLSNIVVPLLVAMQNYFCDS